MLASAAGGRRPLDDGAAPPRAGEHGSGSSPWQKHLWAARNEEMTRRPRGSEILGVFARCLGASVCKPRCLQAVVSFPTACQGQSEDGMERRGEFRVSVSKDYLVFASAHFITFAGHRCEGLHGHNYRVQRHDRRRVEQEKPGSSSTSSSSSASCAGCATRSIIWCCCRSERSASRSPKRQGDERRRGGRRPSALCVSAPRLRAAADPEYHRRDAGRDADRYACAPRSTRQARRALTAIEMEVEENFGQSAVCRVTLV